MKSTSTKGPDSAVEGRRQNPGQIAKSIGGGQSEPQSTNIFAVWPRFCLLPQLRSLVPGYSFISPSQTTSRLAPRFGFLAHAHFFPSSSPSPPPPPPPTNAEPGPRLVDAFLFSLKIKGLITRAKPLMSTGIFPTNQGSSFFFPFGNLSLYDHRHESDQNAGRSQPKRFPHGEDL